MLIHDIIKIKYVNEGYLPNYPYHLISIEEMCDAFMSSDNTGYFFDSYPCLDNSLTEPYNQLVTVIRYYINELKEYTRSDAYNDYKLPDWVYSYMLGEVISINSDILDIHDLIYPLGVDNIDDIFDAKASIACYQVSKAWVNKLGSLETVEIEGKSYSSRPPTMFGEPHVVKSIRLNITNPISYS